MRFDRTLRMLALFGLSLLQACGLGIDPFPNSPLFKNAGPSLSGTVFFSGTDSQGENHLFQIRSGRVRKIVVPGIPDKGIRNLTAFRGSLYFTANQGGGGLGELDPDYRILRFDPDGRLVVSPFSVPTDTFLKVLGDRLYYAGIGVGTVDLTRLFSWDGVGEPFQFPSSDETASDHPLDPTLFGNRIIYMKTDSPFDPVTGTVVACDLLTGSVSVVKSDLVLSGGVASPFFLVHGSNLYFRTNGAIEQWDGSDQSPSQGLYDENPSFWIPAPGGTYFGAGSLFAYLAGYSSASLLGFGPRRLARAAEIDPDDPSGDGVYASGKIYYRCGDANTPMRLCSYDIGDSAFAELPGSESNQLDWVGYDPMRLLAHRNSVCFTGESQNYGRQLYCLQNGVADPVTSVDGPGPDDPMGLISTPEGLIYSSLRSVGGTLTQQFHLSRDLRSTELIPYDEDYYFGVGDAQTPFEIAPPLLFP